MLSCTAVWFRIIITMGLYCVQVNRSCPRAPCWWLDVGDWAARWHSIWLQQGLVGYHVGRMNIINKEEPWWPVTFLHTLFRNHNTDPNTCDNVVLGLGNNSILSFILFEWHCNVMEWRYWLIVIPDILMVNFHCDFWHLRLSIMMVNSQHKQLCTDLMRNMSSCLQLVAKCNKLENTCLKLTLNP